MEGILLALDGVSTVKGSIFVQGSLVWSYEKKSNKPSPNIVQQYWLLDIRRLLVHGVRFLQLIVT